MGVRQVIALRMATDHGLVAGGCLLQDAAASGGLTAGGLVVMSVSILLVLALTIFCLARILRESHPEEHHHAPLDIDTGDEDT
jgi:hypothetical protein